MKGFAKIAAASVGVALLFVAPAMAQGGGTSIEFSGAFGAGLVTMGAAYGIGKLAASAYDGMSRQPEVANNIQTAMIIAAALIEGFTFYALVICQGQNPWGS